MRRACLTALLALAALMLSTSLTGSSVLQLPNRKPVGKQKRKIVGLGHHHGLLRQGFKPSQQHQEVDARRPRSHGLDRAGVHRGRPLQVPRILRAENAPLSNWVDGSFGLAGFGLFLGDTPSQHWFYVVRMILSITIVLTCLYSVLIALIDAVCLEVGRTAS